MKRAEKKDIYKMVTDRILEALEKGIVPWQKPWTGGALGMPKNLVSKKAYRGSNIFLLGIVAECEGYESPYWVTYKQAKSLGGNVKKGQKGCHVVFWKFLDREVEVNGEMKVDSIPFLRYYTVFNIDQCENLDEKKLPEKPKVDELDFQPIEKCEQVVDGMKQRPEIEFKEQRAYYRPSTDTVNMPKEKSFVGEEEYYSTLFHELVHSTGHYSRLNRKGVSKIAARGEDYSKEELIAEMGAAMLCAMTGIVDKTLDNTASYIDNWMRAIRDDKKLVVCAAGKAQKAADFILGE